MEEDIFEYANNIDPAILDYWKEEIRRIQIQHWNECWEMEAP